MKLQKRVNRRVGDKEYLKLYIDLPPNLVKEAGWKEGVELEANTKNGKITLKPKKISSL